MQTGWWYMVLWVLNHLALDKPSHFPWHSEACMLFFQYSSDNVSYRQHQINILAVGYLRPEKRFPLLVFAVQNDQDACAMMFWLSQPALTVSFHFSCTCSIIKAKKAKKCNIMSVCRERLVEYFCRDIFSHPVRVNWSALIFLMCFGYKISIILRQVQNMRWFYLDLVPLFWREYSKKEIYM